MKKPAFIFTLLLACTGITVSAESIYTSGAAEYIEALHRAGGEYGYSALSDADAEGNECVLLAYSESDLDTRGAKYDIIDDYCIHTLVYSTVSAANSAYEYYASNDVPVCRDRVMEMCSDSSLSWGSAYIGSPQLMQAVNELYAGSEMPEINVAVIDSGVDYTHPFLSVRIKTELGYDFCSRDSDPMDDNDHGTHVAGIIADNTTANVSIIPIKVTNQKGAMTLTDFKAGFSYALDIGADVINISLSDSVTDQQKRVFSSMFEAAHSNGTVICAAAGNSPENGPRRNADELFPACMDHTIVAANCDRFGNISNTSNYGSVVDIAAPGTDILSTARENSFISMTGTSMSCPFVAASAALLLTRKPDITPDGIEESIKANAAPYPEGAQGEYEGKYGAGILNLSGLFGEKSNLPRLVSGTRNTDGSLSVEIRGVSSEQTIAAAAFRAGRLIRLMRIPSEAKSEPLKCSIEFSEDHDTVKIFVWNSFGFPEPLSEVFTIN